jgi:predicted TIM-barrel fold metal-dependent hydrolase
MKLEEPTPSLTGDGSKEGQAMPERTLPRIVSVDDHVIEPPTMFDEWIPSKYRDRAPRVERRTIPRDSEYFGGFVEGSDGVPADVWFFEKSAYVIRQPIVVLKDPGSFGEERDSTEPVTYDDMHPACYDPKARLRVMDDQHVEASLGFPTFPRFCGQVFSEQTAGDRDLGLAVLRAYNDFMVNEWCGDSGGRLIPLPVVPLWDPALAADEIRRNAARGVRAVAFSEVVGQLGFPSIHHRNWDAFFAACQETETVVCMHIGSSSMMMPLPPDSPDVLRVTTPFFNSFLSIGDFVFSGVLERFPNLKLAYSEGQAGWFPYAIERFDSAYRHHVWARDETKLAELPSTYIKRSVYGCIFDDVHAIENIDKIGPDKLMYEVDFPHADGPFPATLDHITQQFDGIDDETAFKVLRGNAIELFGLSL